MVYRIRECIPGTPLSQRQKARSIPSVGMDDESFRSRFPQRALRVGRGRALAAGGAGTKVANRRGARTPRQATRLFRSAQRTPMPLLCFPAPWSSTTSTRGPSSMSGVSSRTGTRHVPPRAAAEHPRPDRGNDLLLRPAPLSDGDLSAAVAFAAIASVALSTERYDQLADVARDVAGRLDVDAVVQRITDAATKLTGAQFGAFFLENTITNSLPRATISSSRIKVKLRSAF